MSIQPVGMGAAGMKERPIIFSGPMVRAILEGRKTQTRRVITTYEVTGPNGPHVPPDMVDFYRPGDHGDKKWCGAWPVGRPDAHIDSSVRKLCPYGLPGDRLWVRETFLYVGPGSGSDLPEYVEERAKPENHKTSNCWYRSDPSWDSGDPESLRWTSPIHMPRWASRLLLEVTAVRVERLQDISEQDARAEGVEPYMPVDGDGGATEGPAWNRIQFSHGWDALNAKRGYGWASNPWVWVISFRRLDQAARERVKQELVDAAVRESGL